MVCCSTPPSLTTSPASSTTREVRESAFVGARRRIFAWLATMAALSLVGVYVKSGSAHCPLRRARS
eukprot:1801775-Pyramimonas_sp.AAC.1